MSGPPSNDAPGLPFDQDEEAENGGWERAPFVPQPGTRPRGRPPGAKGKAAAQLARYAAAKGLRDPGVMMLEFANAEPWELWQWFVSMDPDGAPTLAEVVVMQLKAAESVQPYFRGKVQAATPPPGELPVLIVGAGPGGQMQAVQATARRYSLVDATAREVADFSQKPEAEPVPSHETEAGDEG